MNNVLNIPEIQANIRSNHGKFIKKYGMQIEKVMADHRILVDIISARLHRVILCFKEEGVIDEIRTHEGLLKTMTLLKNGCSSYIDLVTNGKVVVVKSFISNESFDSDFSSGPEYFYGVDKEDYDWVGFSIRLLDFIHSKVYERKDVLDEKVRSMFSSDNRGGKSTRKSKKE